MFCETCRTKIVNFGRLSGMIRAKIFLKTQLHVYLIEYIMEPNSIMTTYLIFMQYLQGIKKGNLILFQK